MTGRPPAQGPSLALVARSAHRALLAFLIATQVHCGRDADGDGFAAQEGDCDDGDAAVHPEAGEQCDGRDEDCNGTVDDHAGDATSWHEDDDGDGFGVDHLTVTTCEQPDGYAPMGGDCDDADPHAHPGGIDALDGRDANCDGQVGRVKYEGTVDAPVGLSVGGGGDLDGDGRDDVLLSAPYGSGLLLAYGRPVESTVGTWDSVVGGGDGGTQVGSIIADVTGDGVDDLLVGDPIHDEGGWLPGAAFVLAGGSRPGPEANLADAVASFVGEEPDDLAGTAVGSAGDFNGDGQDDLFVTATRSWEASARESVYLVFGPVSPGTSSLSDAPLEVRSQFVEERIGVAVASGDVDGDGLGDLVLGAPTESFHAWIGSAYVVYGTDNPPGLLFPEDSNLTGRGWMDYTGQAVAVGDLDGDGLDDLAVASPGAEDGRGAVDIVPGRSTPFSSGDLRDAGTRLTGEREHDYAGNALAIPGDINGDALDDLVIAAYQEDSAAPLAGAVYVVLGVQGGVPATTLSAADAKQTGEHEGETAGRALAGAGDFDGDGFADYLVGTSGVEKGASYLVLGGAF